MARKARKTEHAGSKKGSGAYWGRKKDAKRDSSKKRRIAGKKEIHWHGNEANGLGSERSEGK